MPGAKNNYNKIAGFYDLLARTVFGNSLLKAQRSLLHYIKDHQKILIAGGGTGALLEELDRLGLQGLQILYVDASSKMIQQAQQRKTVHLSIQFMQVYIEDLKIDTDFDIVITPFLFDNFDSPAAAIVFTVLHNQLLPGGHWMFTDFLTTAQSPLWQRALLKLMYFFFRTTAAVGAHAIPDIHGLFNQFHYQLLYETRFYGHFIQSQVWRKQANS